ncbi:MAG: D-glycero-alpha-D-manno-heptose-1,7-bisphosphate 7-phosphatase [Endomicrobiales bacterium]
MMSILKKAVFMDKDGTVIEDLPYNVDTGKIRLMPGAEKGLRLLHGAGFSLFIVTNQSGIARGYFTEKELGEVESHLRKALFDLDIPLKGFYFCPHLPGGIIPGYDISCGCRKPQPGLIVRAAKEHAIDPSRSWFVGDILNDVEAGRRAGCRTVLINNGKETEWSLSTQRLPHHIVSDFTEAARVITALDAAGERERRTQEELDLLRENPEPARSGVRTA